MTKQQIIEKIANERLVETLIRNVANPITENEDDLTDIAQDIYIVLLNKDDKQIIDLYNNKQLKFFITRIVINNIYSKNSLYYTKYKRYQLRKDGEDKIYKADTED